MKCKVKIKKGQLDYFRKLARKSSPLEIQAYIVGKVNSPDLVTVDKLYYTKLYYSQTSTEVQWYFEDYDRVKKEAEEKGLKVVGDIHSHPNWDAVMSPTDYKAHIEEGFRICGLCSVLNNKTRVRFWISESSLPCEIIYI